MLIKWNNGINLKISIGLDEIVYEEMESFAEMGNTTEFLLTLIAFVDGIFEERENVISITYSPMLL